MVLHPDASSQLDALEIDRFRPLLVSDADEVLVRFVACFEEYLSERSLYLDLRSFALTGNLRRLSDNKPVDRATVGTLLDGFFEERVDRIPPVAGAAEALSALSQRMQIVILTNIPLASVAARSRSLAGHGMDYPVIANRGAKGGVVAALAARVEAPVFFIDDLPPQIASVATAAEQVVRLHFVADPRLAALLEPAAESHHRCDDWPAARAYIEHELSRLNF